MPPTSDGVRTISWWSIWPAKIVSFCVLLLVEHVAGSFKSQISQRPVPQPTFTYACGLAGRCDYLYPTETDEGCVVSCARLSRLDCLWGLTGTYASSHRCHVDFVHCYYVRVFSSSAKSPADMFELSPATQWQTSS